MIAFTLIGYPMTCLLPLVPTSTHTHYVITLFITSSYYFLYTKDSPTYIIYRLEEHKVLYVKLINIFFFNRSKF